MRFLVALFLTLISCTRPNPAYEDDDGDTGVGGSHSTTTVGSSATTTSGHGTSITSIASDGPGQTSGLDTTAGGLVVTSDPPDTTTGECLVVIFENECLCEGMPDVQPPPCGPCYWLDDGCWCEVGGYAPASWCVNCDTGSTTESSSDTFCATGTSGEA